METTTSGTVWVCVDCYMAHHGITEQERGEAYPPGTLSLLGDSDVSAGLVSAEHDTPCGSFDHAGGDFLGGECECEQRSFSWAQCDGCGSPLGGSRDALTVWFRQTCSSCGVREASDDASQDQRYLCERCL